MVTDIKDKATLTDIQGQGSDDRHLKQGSDDKFKDKAVKKDIDDNQKPSDGNARQGTKNQAMATEPKMRH